ncbi:cyclohexanecarboxylate-CoA ligase, partial [Enterococcus faecium]
LTGVSLPGTVSYGELADSTAPGFAPAATTTRDRCLLVYTSGTTAQPKGVQHSHAGLLGDMASMDEMRGHRSEMPMLSVFPSGHIAGTLGILRMFCRAGTTVTMDAWNPEQAARLIASHGVGASAGAPIHLGGILDV